MKGLKSTLAILLLAITACASTPNFKRAYDLFIPIACTSPEYFRAKIGTGFPVAEHTVMTAGHVACAEGAITEISLDKGKSWIVVPLDKMFVANGFDVRAYVLKDVEFKGFAKFRAAKLGEEVAGYGIAFDEVATFGRVIQVREDHVDSTSVPIGGMSGSALVGMDGQVVGMVVLAVPTFVGQGVVTSYVTRAVPGEVLQALLKNLSNS